jgi:hypothetical protein
VTALRNLAQPGNFSVYTLMAGSQGLAPGVTKNREEAETVGLGLSQRSAEETELFFFFFSFF